VRYQKRESSTSREGRRERRLILSARRQAGIDAYLTKGDLKNEGMKAASAHLLLLTKRRRERISRKKKERRG